MRPLLCVFVTLIFGVLPSAIAAEPASAFVSIRGLRYNPPTVRINVGGTVTWSNDDEFDHTVVADDGSFSSGNLKSGRTFSHRFNQRGTYGYGCRLHPRMRGSVVVE